MALSTEELNKRYGQFDSITTIRKMIEDMVDTDIIMEEVRSYGRQRFHSGQNDAFSRTNVRPGDGDMGG